MSLKENTSIFLLLLHLMSFGGTVIGSRAEPTKDSHRTTDNQINHRTSYGDTSMYHGWREDLSHPSHGKWESPYGDAMPLIEEDLSQMNWRRYLQEYRRRWHQHNHPSNHHHAREANGPKVKRAYTDMTFEEGFQDTNSITDQSQVANEDYVPKPKHIAIQDDGVEPSPSDPPSGDIQDQNVTCNETSWRCDSGKCIPIENVCSGTVECNDGSDEHPRHCGCLENEFNCSGKCIDIYKRCDMTEDCEGGEDEQDCSTYTCQETHTKCHDSFCIPKDYLCDFKFDCRDGSDEICKYPDCRHGEFKCTNKQCVQPSDVCDGRNDCEDGTDEEDCEIDDFKVCGDKRKVYKRFLCDGLLQCEDNHADELGCNSTKTRTYRCNNDRYIMEGNTCDGWCDCLGCEDELECHPKTYDNSSGIVMCQKGVAITCERPFKSRHYDRCISAQYICDGINQCQTGGSLSDELGCDVKEVDCRAVNGVRCGGKDRRCLPEKLVCDNKEDCLNGEDEHNCTHHRVCTEDEFRCASGECVPLKSRCDRKINCTDKSDEVNCFNHECAPGFFKCRTGQCAEEHRRCNHFVDCFDASDEGEHCNYTIPTCKESEFQCITVNMCIPLSQRCVYERDSDSHGCADGSHIWECENATCSAEENLIKCDRGPCIHERRRCDHLLDCKESASDEKGCEYPCPMKSEITCTCHNLMANCTGKNLPDFLDIDTNLNVYIYADNYLNETLDNKVIEKNLFMLVTLDISRNHIRNLAEGTFAKLWRLKHLNLRDNHLTNLKKGVFKRLHKLTELQLNGNQIKTLEPEAFSGLLLLQNLDLSFQGLENIQPRAFVGLSALSTLSLANNHLTTLKKGVFSGLKNLRELDLRNNSLKLEDYPFEELPVNTSLKTDDWRLCCQATHLRECLPKGDEFSTCEDLMSNIVLRVFIWVLGIIALVGNAFVILWRISVRHHNELNPTKSNAKVDSFLLLNLASGDFLMGVYLLIVAAKDVELRGIYLSREQAWRESGLCQLAGFLSTFSSELSVFILTVISVKRAIVIHDPMKVNNNKVLYKVIIGIWLLAAFLSAVPFLPVAYFDNFYGRSGVCLALHITNEKPSGWEYAVFIFLALNLLNFIVIAISYILIYCKLSKRDDQMKRNSHVQRQEERYGNWITLIVATDAACWLPIIFLGISSLYGVTIPPKVYSWVAVFILPLNAAVNPILYTIAGSTFRQQLQRLRSRSSRASSAITRDTFMRPARTESERDSRIHETEVCLKDFKPSVRLCNSTPKGSKK